MDYTDQGTAAGVALGLTFLLRQSGYVPDKALPLLAIVIAVVVAMGMASSWDFKTGVSGLIAGLSASGAWSGGKTIAGK